MSKIPYSFKCDSETDKEIIQLLSDCSNKTLFIKQCIKHAVDNKIILDNLTEIRNQLDILIQQKKDIPLESVYNKEPLIKSDIKNENIPVQKIEQTAAGLLTVEPDIDVTESSSPAVDKIVDSESEQLKKNVLNCMSKFINI